MAPDPTHPGLDQEFRQLQRNKDFYLNGGDLHILVGNQKFRVHKYFFERESRFFREKLEVSNPPGKPRKGDDETTAIVLDDASPADFEKLLWVFYNPRYTLYDWDTEDWTTLLALAVKWEFSEVKDLAIRELDHKDLPLLPRIVLYQRFSVNSARLIPLYAELCSRPDALNEQDAEALGLKTTVLIFRARERLRALPSNEGKSPLPAGLEEHDVHRTINSLLTGSDASVVETEIQAETKSEVNPDPTRKVNKNSNRRHVGANK